MVPRTANEPSAVAGPAGAWPSGVAVAMPSLDRLSTTKGLSGATVKFSAYGGENGLPARSV